MSRPELSLIVRLRMHADAIEAWREDDDEGAACIELTCDAEDLLREAVNALQTIADVATNGTVPK